MRLCREYEMSAFGAKHDPTRTRRDWKIEERNGKTILQKWKSIFLVFSAFEFDSEGHTAVRRCQQQIVTWPFYERLLQSNRPKVTIKLIVQAPSCQIYRLGEFSSTPMSLHAIWVSFSTHMLFGDNSTKCQITSTIFSSGECLWNVCFFVFFHYSYKSEIIFFSFMLKLMFHACMISCIWHKARRRINQNGMHSHYSSAECRWKKGNTGSRIRSYQIHFAAYS